MYRWNGNSRAVWGPESSSSWSCTSLHQETGGTGGAGASTGSTGHPHAERRNMSWLMDTDLSVKTGWLLTTQVYSSLLAGLRHWALCLHFAGWSSECVASWYPVCPSSGALQGCLLALRIGCFQRSWLSTGSKIMLNPNCSLDRCGSIWGFIPPSWTP